MSTALSCQHAYVCQHRLSSMWGAQIGLDQLTYGAPTLLSHAAIASDKHALRVHARLTVHDTAAQFGSGTGDLAGPLCNVLLMTYVALVVEGVRPDSCLFVALWCGCAKQGASRR